MNYPNKLQVGETIYPIEYLPVLKSTSSVRIKKGIVMLKLSRFAQGTKRDEIVEKFLKWAEKRLAKLAAVSTGDFINPVYEDGGRIVTHNKVYDLRVDFVSYKNLRARLVDSNILKIGIPAGMLPSTAAKKIKQLAEDLIIEDQTPYLCEVLEELNQLYFQERINSCRFKRTSSRFGSCSSKRNINIAFRLLFAPREVFRYVCVHELSHLKQFNHSKHFWDWVESAMPNYKESERWLRNKGFMLG